MSDLSWTSNDETGQTVGYVGEGSTVKVHLWLRKIANGRSELVASVFGKGGWQLSECIFQVRVSSNSSDSLVWPYAAGAVVPVEELADAGRTLELTYPVYASMQWVDVFSRDRGVYVAAHDGEPYFKNIRANVEKQRGRRTVVVEFAYTDLEWPSGKEWTSPPLVVASHRGDWQQGAKIYRTWANSWFRREQVPLFMQRTAGHNMIAFSNPHGRMAYKDFREVASRSRRLGFDGVHLADWMRPGYDAFYPEYKADPALGGERSLSKAIRDMTSDGMWTCLYLNGRLLDPAGPYGHHAFEWAAKQPQRVKRRFDEMWKRTQDPKCPGWNPAMAIPKKAAPFNVDGTAAEEWWGRVLSPMCPSVSAWQQLWLSRISDVATRYRPQMFQVDQVCGCWGMPCYDENHPHCSPALAWSDYKAFTWSMRHRAHEIDPDIAFWSEGVNDMLGQAFDGLQMNLGFDSLLAGLGEWDPRVFKFTFPEFVLVTGDIGGHDLAHVAWAIVTGAHFHAFIPEPEKLERETRRWIQFAIRIRSRYWREFMSSDVFVPEVAGDGGVRVLGYRRRNRVLLAGAPFDSSQRSFRVRLSIPEDYRVSRTEWLNKGGRGSVKARNGHCDLVGTGPFVIVLNAS